jgi:hypothetical protein
LDEAALKSGPASERRKKLLEAPRAWWTQAARQQNDEKTLVRWANIADKLRSKGMGRDYAGLLREVGVHTVKELQYRNPGKLAQSMAEANRKRKLVRFLPSEKLITRWIEHARKLPQKITY